ncbi:hypothetical protein D3C76_1059470 [compost metagenome]
MFPIQALPHRVKRQQAINREVPPDLVEELQIADTIEPLRVVDHEARSLPQMQVATESPRDAGDIGLNLRLIEYRSALVPEAWVTDTRCRATDQQDRTVPGLLQPAH